MSFPLSTQIYHIVNTFKAVLAAPDDALLNMALYENSLREIASVLAYYGMMHNGVWYKQRVEKFDKRGNPYWEEEWAKTNLEQMTVSLTGEQSNVGNTEERHLQTARTLVEWQIEGGNIESIFDWDKSPLGQAYAQYKFIYGYYNRRGADGNGKFDRDAIVIHEALNGGYFFIGGLQPNFHKDNVEYVASLTAAFKGEELPEWVAQQDEERRRYEYQGANNKALKREVLKNLSVKVVHTHNSEEVTDDGIGNKRKQVWWHWHITITNDDHPNVQTYVVPDFTTGEAYTNSKLPQYYSVGFGKQSTRQRKHQIDAETVLGGLISDAQTAMSGMTIDDIAEEFGITKPSEAMRVHTARHETYRKLVVFLGQDLFDKACEVQW